MIYKLMKTIKNLSLAKQPMKIKLIAIAKDEAAYIPEWVYHHLQFGFDSISIYTNGINDNSREVISKISQKYPVEDVDADYIPKRLRPPNFFQREAYTIALQQAVRDEFTHALWLDIDEFWTPLDFNQSIKEFIMSLNGPDIVSFIWGVKTGEKIFMGRPFEQFNNIGSRHFVKSLFKTSTNIDHIRVHNIISPSSKNVLADGSPFIGGDQNGSKVKKLPPALMPAFILHRISRSPIEYVSLLGRGDSKSPNNTTRLKKNRRGYLKKKSDDIKFEINQDLLKQYNTGYEKFIRELDLESELTTAKKFVRSRYQEVVDRIAQFPPAEHEILTRILKNVELPEVVDAYNRYLNVIGNGSLGVDNS